MREMPWTFEEITLIDEYLLNVNIDGCTCKVFFG